jgi:hypothetical protein
MNRLTRWKVVLRLIAISVAGALTGGFLTKRAIKDVMRRPEEHAYRLLVGLNRDMPIFALQNCSVRLP